MKTSSMGRVVSFLIPFAAIVSSHAETKRIGKEALVDLPTSAEWSSVVNFRPGDREVVTLNPPRFSWSYTPDPRNAHADVEAKRFIFQVAYDPSFASLVVNVTNASNMYNFLAPFATNQTAYWRVGYIGTGQQQPYTWSATRSFTIATNAVTWDRSMLADERYLAAKAAHPHMLFNNDTKSALLQWLKTKAHGNSWTTISKGANKAIASISWNLIGRWTFDVKANPEYDFADGNAMAFQYTAGAYSSAGRFGGSMSADGKNYATLQDAYRGLSNYTLVAWVNISTNGPDVFMSVWDNGQDCIALKPSGGMSVTLGGKTTKISTSANANLWVRIALVSSNKTVSVYRNTSKMTSMAGVVPTVSASSFCRSNDAAVALIGRLDEVELFNRPAALSDLTLLFASVTSLGDNLRARDLGYVAMVWQLTGQRELADALPQEVLVRCAHCWLHQRGYMADSITHGRWKPVLQNMAYAYDWLYPIMTQTQRADVLEGLRQRCRYITHGHQWFYNPKKPAYDYGKGDPTGAYADGVYVRNVSGFKRGFSHGINNFQQSMGAALAAYGDDPWCRDLFDLGLNYMIGVTYPYGFDAAANQGLCYAKVHLFFGTGDGVMQHFVADTVFPEVHFYKNPFWKGVGEWFSRMAPVGFVEADNTWGDACWGLYSVFRRQVGPNLSYYTGSRNLYDHWLAEPASKKDENTVGIENVVLPYYFPPPSGPLEPWPLSRLFASDGWVFGASVPSYANNAFNNGVGFSIIARPRGSEGGHSHFNDLNFQLWAYGTTLTDGGSGMSTYAKHAMSHNCLLVNGIGMVQSQLAPLEPWYARVIAYQTGENYTYCATDGTWAYPHKPFVLGGWLTPSGFASNGYAAGALNAVTKVQRHLLFMRGKYFVFYDEMASTNAATFSWLYQVCENTVSQVDSNTASFTYTSNTRRLTGYDTKAPSVTVLVKHIASNVTLTDMSGINVRSNPITGENYYDDGNMQHIRAHVMWVSNRTPATNFHFLSVVYPIKPGTASPEIKRLDDYTVEVTNGDEHDVISFDSQTKQPVTLLVDLAGLTSGSQPPEAARQGSASDQ